MQKTFVTDKPTNEALDKLRVETGINHSEAIRRSVQFYCNSKLGIKVSQKKARR